MPHPGSPAAVVLALLAAAGTTARPTAPAPRPAPVRLAPSPIPLAWTVHLMFTHEGQRLTAQREDTRWISWDLRRPARPPQLGPERGSDGDQLFLAPTGWVGIELYPKGPEDPLFRPRAFIEPGTGRTLRRLDPPELDRTVPLDTPCLFSTDGCRFVANRRYLFHPDSFGTDVGLTVWDVTTGKRVGTLPTWGGQNGPLVELTAAAISPNGKAVLVKVEARQFEIDCVGVWEPDTGRCRWARPAEQLDGWLGSRTRFTADGKRLVTGYFVGAKPERTRADLLSGIRELAGRNRWQVMFRVFDASTGAIVREVQGPAAGWFKMPRLIFGPGESVHEFVWPTLRAEAVSPDGKTAAIWGTDESIYLWNLETDQPRARLAHPGQVAGLAFHPDGRTLAVVDEDGGAVLYPIADVMAGAR